MTAFTVVAPLLPALTATMAQAQCRTPARHTLQLVPGDHQHRMHERSVVSARINITVR